MRIQAFPNTANTDYTLAVNSVKSDIRAVIFFLIHCRNYIWQNVCSDLTYLIVASLKSDRLCIWLSHEEICYFQQLRYTNFKF